MEDSGYSYLFSIHNIKSYIVLSSHENLQSKGTTLLMIKTVHLLVWLCRNMLLIVGYRKNMNCLLNGLSILTSHTTNVIHSAAFSGNCFISK